MYQQVGEDPDQWPLGDLRAGVCSECPREVIVGQLECCVLTEAGEAWEVERPDEQLEELGEWVQVCKVQSRMVQTF